MLSAREMSEALFWSQNGSKRRARRFSWLVLTEDHFEEESNSDCVSTQSTCGSKTRHALMEGGGEEETQNLDSLHYGLPIQKTGTSV